MEPQNSENFDDNMESHIFNDHFNPSNLNLEVIIYNTIGFT